MSWIVHMSSASVAASHGGISSMSRGSAFAPSISTGNPAEEDAIEDEKRELDPVPGVPLESLPASQRWFKEPEQQWPDSAYYTNLMEKEKNHPESYQIFPFMVPPEIRYPCKTDHAYLKNKFPDLFGKKKLIYAAIMDPMLNERRLRESDESLMTHFQFQLVFEMYPQNFYSFVFRTSLSALDFLDRKITKFERLNGLLFADRDMKLFIDETANNGQCGLSAKRQEAIRRENKYLRRRPRLPSGWRRRKQRWVKGNRGMDKWVKKIRDYIQFLFSSEGLLIQRWFWDNLTSTASDEVGRSIPWIIRNTIKKAAQRRLDMFRSLSESRMDILKQTRINLIPRGPPRRDAGPSDGSLSITSRQYQGRNRLTKGERDRIFRRCRVLRRPVANRRANGIFFHWVIVFESNVGLLSIQWYADEGGSIVAKSFKHDQFGRRVCLFDWKVDTDGTAFLYPNNPEMTNGQGNRDVIKVPVFFNNRWMLLASFNLDGGACDDPSNYHGLTDAAVANYVRHVFEANSNYDLFRFNCQHFCCRLVSLFNRERSSDLSGLMDTMIGVAVFPGMIVAKYLQEVREAETDYHERTERAGRAAERKRAERHDEKNTDDDWIEQDGLRRSLSASTNEFVEDRGRHQTACRPSHDDRERIDPRGRARHERQMSDVIWSQYYPHSQDRSRREKRHGRRDNLRLDWIQQTTPALNGQGARGKPGRRRRTEKNGRIYASEQPYPSEKESAGRGTNLNRHVDRPRRERRRPRRSQASQNTLSESRY